MPELIGKVVYYLIIALAVLGGAFLYWRAFS